MTPARAPAPLLDYALLGLLSLLWAGSYAFTKLALAGFPPVTLVALRVLIAGLVLLALLRAKGLALPLDGRSVRLYARQAVFNSLVPFSLITLGQQHVGSALATVLSSTAPIFAWLIALLPGMGGAPSVRRGIGVAAGFAGVVLIMGPEAMGGLGTGLLAQLALLGGGASFAIAAFVGRGFPGHHALVPAAGALLLAAVPLVPLSLALDAPWTLRPGWPAVLGLLGMSLLSTALGFVIYFRLLGSLGVAGATAQAYLRVPIGAAIGVLLFGELLPPLAWAGFAAVLAGVVLMTLPERR